MTPRSIRRAAERKAIKAASRNAVADHPAPVSVPQQSLSDELCFHPEPFEDDVHPTARAAANRANARFSTGPRTPEGKAISSLNAVKTGLTGRTVVLASEDAAAYEQHIRDYETEYKPEGLRERELVQSLADTSWRLKRIPGLEMAIYALGRLEFEDSFEEHRPDLRAGMMDLQTHLKYEKQLRNLQLQESRLQRRYGKETAELRALQKERQSAAVSQAAASAEPPALASAAYATNGFEFSDTLAEATSALPILHRAPISDTTQRL